MPVPDGGTAWLRCLEASPDIGLLVTPSGQCVHANARGRQHLARAGPDSAPTVFGLFPDTESRSAISEGIAAAFASGSWSGETLMTGPDQVEMPVSVVITAPKAGEEAPAALVQMRDLTERYRAESTLAGALLRSQDEERRRIGRELHDSTAQVLAALEISLCRLERVFDTAGSPHTDSVRECVRMAARCSLELRTMSALLHPPLLEDLGLCNTLRWYVARFSQRSGIRAELEAPDDDTRWPGHIELTLFRITQESLSNILRHSQSPTATIRLESRERSVRLEVEDHGCGLPERVLRHMDSAADGVGLSGMRQRVRELHGRFSVESRPGLTRILASIPLPAPTE